jgi:hypothetical protein
MLKVVLFFGGKNGKTMLARQMLPVQRKKGGRERAFFVFYLIIYLFCPGGACPAGFCLSFAP